MMGGFRGSLEFQVTCLECRIVGGEIEWAGEQDEDGSDRVEVGGMLAAWPGGLQLAQGTALSTPWILIKVESMAGLSGACVG
jgi:hypothetical protein